MAASHCISSLPLPHILPSRRLQLRRSTIVSATLTDAQHPTPPTRHNFGGLHHINSSDDRRRFSKYDYFQLSIQLINSADSGPPRWFSPLIYGSRPQDTPLLLYLPGIDGLGTSLLLQSESLGEIFEIWCLHIPLTDQSPFTDLMKLVEETVRLENSRRPNCPIYLVGESFGGCLALALAAHNPDIDLILILANPATCFLKSQLQPFLPLLEIMPQPVFPSLFYLLSVMTGNPSKLVMNTLEKGLALDLNFGKASQHAVDFSSFISVMVDAFNPDKLTWKLKLLKSAASFANSRLHAVKARTLILSSGNDQLLPSREEGERLRHMLPNCEMRMLNNNGHALFLDDNFDLVTVIKGTGFYQRGQCRDYVSDYLPPKPSEFEQVHEPYRVLEVATNPVLLSTLDDGKIVRGLSGIPSEGPAIYVGYHMMLGLELVPLVSRFWTDRKIVLRGMAHPLTFRKLKEGKLPDLSTYDAFRFMGAVPVSATNFYKLCSSKAHILLYPGGMREALHRKGEEYKLIWPDRSEFVRMAARFGAKIIPFGVMGEDDIGQLLFDYDDLMKFPYFKEFTQNLTDEAVKLRTDTGGELSNQDIHLPVIVPKLPGRFYFLFGKPIETDGRKQELKCRDTAHELYLKVKEEVGSCIGYLREKRETDPYRSVMARLAYQATHGFDCEVPTFRL